MMKRFLPLLVLLAGVGACSPGGDQATDSDVQDTPAPVETAEAEPEVVGTTIVSTNGSSQITVPEGWEETDELNDVAIIQAANLAEDQYVIVIDDSKEDFADASLETFSEITAETFLDILDDPTLGEPVTLTINGNPALQQQVEGSIENTNVVYLQTNIETPTHFYQVLTWSLKSRFEDNRDIFEGVTESFQEVSE